MGPCEDQQALAAGIERLIRDKTLREELGTAAAGRMRSVDNNDAFDLWEKAVTGEIS